MAKQIKYGVDARKALEAGVNQLSQQCKMHFTLPVCQLDNG